MIFQLVDYTTSIALVLSFRHPVSEQHKRPWLIDPKEPYKEKEEAKGFMYRSETLSSLGYE